MTTIQASVHVVDDDPDVLELLAALLRSVNLNVETYTSAEEFLENYSDSPDSPTCLVLDAFMPDMDGLDLQEKLAENGVDIPIIMISAYADVPLAVQAMSSGAVAFLEKPFSRQALLKHVRKAIDRDAYRLREKAQRTDLAARLTTLSFREREVMDLLVAGKHTKHIAKELGICDQTVARHRSRVLEKMGVENVAELVRVVLTFGFSSANTGVDPTGIGARA